jgi:hypothetical protein
MRYLGMMLDSAGIIRGIRTIVRDDDLSALHAARRALEHSHPYEAVEVWRQGHRIAKVSRPDDA